MSGYMFFLSHAGPTADGYLRRFYEDLVSQISLITSHTKERIGFFLDSNLELGQEWPHGLTEALQTSQVFLPVLTPDYFNSEFCGKEWKIFEARQDAYWGTQSFHPERPDHLIPILWGSPRKLPDLASSIQYEFQEFGDLYARYGLQSLLKLSKYKWEYNEIIKRLAHKVISAVQSYLLPPLPDLQPLRFVESAFHIPTRPPVSQIVTKGPRSAQFVFIAATRTEIEGIRSHTDSYGESGNDWRPFFPVLTRPIGVIAQQIACEKDFYTDLLAVDSDLIRRLVDAEHNNNVAIIIVDPWTLKLEQYHRLMTDYDNHIFLNSAVLLTWNMRDNETLSNLENLKLLVGSTFRRNVIMRAQNLRLEINSSDDLHAELSDTLDQVRMDIISNVGTVHRVETSSIVKPVLRGPGEGSI